MEGKKTHLADSLADFDPLSQPAQPAAGQSNLYPSTNPFSEPPTTTTPAAAPLYPATADPFAPQLGTAPAPHEDLFATRNTGSTPTQGRVEGDTLGVERLSVSGGDGAVSPVPPASPNLSRPELYGGPWQTFWGLSDANNSPGLVVEKQLEHSATVNFELPGKYRLVVWAQPYTWGAHTASNSELAGAVMSLEVSKNGKSMFKPPSLDLGVENPAEFYFSLVPQAVPSTGKFTCKTAQPVPNFRIFASVAYFVDDDRGFEDEENASDRAERPAPLDAPPSYRQSAHYPSQPEIFGQPERPLIPIHKGLRSYSKTAAYIIRRFIGDIDPRYVQRAAGICAIRMYKAGYFFTVKAGTGVMCARLPDGRWSLPSAVSMGGVGFGVDIGVQWTDFLIVLSSHKAVEAFATNNLSLGTDFAVSVGPVGADMGTELTTKSAILTFGKSRGLYVGISLEGGVIKERTDSNKKWYKEATGGKVKAKELLAGEPHPRDFDALEVHRALHELEHSAVVYVYTDY
eukprot:comp20603_c0_seq1/m.26575 comp20603_c0_seq1/g.26575  ORF comp20603_c0_seq1/g.26575 comp20603_c0_seq1/m.26575 type:complete len:514 (-) comp20603_c0_seq1:642-2183(-)